MQKDQETKSPRLAATSRGSDALRLDGMDADDAFRTCDYLGCAEPGTHPAPKSPIRLKDYHWFCLEHVREYNKSWNYYRDMSDDELENAIRRATTWERPSWPFGTRREDGRAYTGAAFQDNFGLFDDDPVVGDRGTQKNRQTVDTPEARACVVIGLSPPITMEELKVRYKELVKLNHPDRNDGDKDAEERLKLINEAYTTLKRFLT